MKTKKMRADIEALARIHTQLGDQYLEMCEASDIEPFPVVWHTFPPHPDGQTQAYLMFGYDGEEDEWKQQGVDIDAPTRAELVHMVFLKALTLRCVN